MDDRARYESWRNSPVLSGSQRQELQAISHQPEEIRDRFYCTLQFGTAGLRGVMGMGLNRMNEYVIRQATEAFARVILNQDPANADKGVCLCYDCRINSRFFAEVAAHALRRHGIMVRMFAQCRPTPQLSFAVRHFGAAAGINVTASHNPKAYNGYKVYWSDGAQLPPDKAALVAEEMERIPVLAPDGPADNGLAPLIWLEEDFDRVYLDAVMKNAIDRKIVPRVADSFRLVYTPFHGVGGFIVPRLLEEMGMKNVEYVGEQMEPDGTFPTVKSPNPEEPEGFALAIRLAERTGAQLIVGTDPDSDRVGIIVRDQNGAYVPVSGNRTGALLLNYILTAGKRCGTLPVHPALIKTIVTTELSRKIALENGAACFDTFTGFKFMAEKVHALEKEGRWQYVMAYEESYGYMIGDHARDKDGVVATLLLTEMAAWYHSRGMTVLDGLQELWDTYGYYAEHTINAMFPGADGMTRMGRIMDALRSAPPAQLNGCPAVRLRDYQTGLARRMDGTAQEALELKGSNVLYFELADGTMLVVRPSGTEPKIKIYALARGESLAQAEERADEYSRAARDLLLTI